MIVAGAFLFEQLLDFFTCFDKPILVFSGQQANSFSHGFLVVWSSPTSTVSQALQLSHKSFFQHDLEIVARWLSGLGDVYWPQIWDLTKIPPCGRHRIKSHMHQNIHRLPRGKSTYRLNFL